MAEAAMLERHIMQAQARAMSADERELNRVSSGLQRFPDLGLPPGKLAIVQNPFRVVQPKMCYLTTIYNIFAGNLLV